MAKQPVISFRVDPDTYAMVQKVAASRCESVGAFAKEKLLEGMAELSSPEVEVESMREEIHALRIQHAKGIELLARLVCREDPNVRSEEEEPVAAWVQREIPR